MSRGVIDGMPDDGRWWVVLWYDRFIFCLNGTTSTGITVLIQDLQPIGDRDATGKVAPIPGDLVSWRQNPLLPDGTRRYQQRLVRIFVGSLGLLHIGKIIHKRKGAGSLPVERRTLVWDRQDSLPDQPAADPLNVGVLGTDLPGPPSWTLETAENVIDQRSIAGITHLFPRSRFLHHLQDGVSYIIPRSEIYRRFYACTSELANAIESQHWLEAMKDLVYWETMESGLESGKFENPTRYQIILKESSDTLLARLLAILCLDDFGKICAKEIFNKKKSERSRSLDYWFTAARIPLDGTRGEPIAIDVEGWDIGFRGPDDRPVFLVTRLTTCAIPSYLPPVWYELVRSNRRSENPRAEPPRQRGTGGRAPLIQEGGADVILSNSAEGNAGAALVVVPTDDPLWRDSTPLPIIPKTSHRSTEGGRTRAPQPPPSEISAGRRGSVRGNPAAASVGGESIRHERFASLFAACNHLLNAQHISGFMLFPPEDTGLIAQRLGEQSGRQLFCWDLRAIEEKAFRRKPSAWCYAQRPIAGYPEVYVARSACVVSIEGPVGRGFWIELETRPGEHFRSLVLARPTGNHQQVVESALVGILACKGIAPAEGVTTHAGASLACRPMDFRHAYDPPESSQMSWRFVLRSLIASRICE